MNNLQLSLLLGQYLARLNAALGEIKDTLPEEMIERGTNFLGHPTASYPCLESLIDLAADIRIAVEKLENSSDKNAT